MTAKIQQKTEDEGSMMKNPWQLSAKRWDILPNCATRLSPKSFNNALVDCANQKVINMIA